MLRKLLNPYFLIILALYVLLRSVVINWYELPTISMEPTFKKGENFIFVSLLSFGLRLPFSKSALIEWGEPKAGDLVTFRSPTQGDVIYLMRVIAVPGDTIAFSKGYPILNGKPIAQNPVLDPQIYLQFRGTETIDGTIFRESIGETSYYVQYVERRGDSDTELIRNLPINPIPANHYYLLGDNRKYLIRQSLLGNSPSTRSPRPSTSLVFEN